MKILSHAEKKFSSHNSLDAISEQKIMFLVNYLGGRAITWHIDAPVRDAYPNIEQNIVDLEKIGLIKIERNVYVLTEAGMEIRKKFREQEKIRNKEMIHNSISMAIAGDYLGAYNARTIYEKNSVIPHGINISFGGNKQSLNDSSLPCNVKNYIRLSYQLDFSDCRNSESFKGAMRALYVGMEISGASKIEPPASFESDLGEYIDCPALDQQLKEKCMFPNPPKFRIYFDTKVRVLRFTNVGLLKKWDGQFFLGMYDCTVPYHATMAQYERMKEARIEGFPKTFKTFEKHKNANSEKYKSWIAQYKGGII